MNILKFMLSSLLVSTILTACGSDDKAANPAVPAPAPTVKPSAVDANGMCTEAVVKEVETKTEMQFPKRTLHGFSASAYTGKEILIWGTLYGFTSPTAAGEIYNPETNTWTTMTEINNPGPKIEYPRGVWTGQEFLVFDENNPSVIWSLK